MLIKMNFVRKKMVFIYKKAGMFEIICKTKERKKTDAIRKRSERAIKHKKYKVEVGN